MLVVSFLQVVPSAIVIGAFCSTAFAHFPPTISIVPSVTPPRPTLTLYVKHLQIAQIILGDGECCPVLIQILYSNAPPHSITTTQTTKHITSGATIKKFATDSSTHNSMSPEHTTSESPSHSPPSLTLANGPLSSDTTTFPTLDGTTAISSTGASTEGNVSSGSKTETSTTISPTTVPRTSGSVNLLGQIPVGILGVIVLQAHFWIEYFGLFK